MQSPASPMASAVTTPSEEGSPILSPRESPNLGDIGSPSSPLSSPMDGQPWKPGHGRRTSLGTTKGSPSNRRRSLDQTMHLIRDVVEGKEAGSNDSPIERIAEAIGSPTNSPIKSKPSHSLA